jgi:hypothetical protein
MKLPEAAQKFEMMLAPGDDIVEVVAGGDGGTAHQQQDFVEPIHDPSRSRPSENSEKCSKSSATPARGKSSPANMLTSSMIALPAESGRPGNHDPLSTQNHPNHVVN